MVTAPPSFRYRRSFCGGRILLCDRYFVNTKVQLSAFHATLRDR
jgi:hypothetical protein